MNIRIDRAGPHAGSLLSLTAAGLLRLHSHSCDEVLADELTDAQYLLGFKADVHAGLDGKRGATAPTWVWESGRAADLLREFEGPFSIRSENLGGGSSSIEFSGTSAGTGAGTGTGAGSGARLAAITSSSRWRSRSFSRLSSMI